MGKQRVMGIAAAALLAFTAACDDNSTAPAAMGLDSGEGEFIALQTSAVLSSLVGDYLNTLGDAPVVAFEGTALAGAAEEIVTTFDFVRTRPCAAGGQVVATGSGTRIHDRDAHTVSNNGSGTKDIQDCARVRGDLTFTTNGSGNFDFSRYRVNGAFSGLQTTNQDGSFTVTVSDGRTEDCTYELHRVLDPDAGTITVTGQVCGNDVDKTMEWNG